MKQKDIFVRWRNLLLAGLGCAGLILIFYLLGLRGIGIPCVFRKLTGFSCPGCGNSRAALALLRLDAMAALQYNLLFPVEFGYLGWVVLHCAGRYLKGGSVAYRPPWPWLDALVLALVLLWWPLRNWLGM